MKAYFKIAITSLLLLSVSGCDRSPASRPTGEGSSIVINSTSDPSDVQTGAPVRGDTIISASRTVAKSEILTVKSGETLYIKDGAELTVDGDINCENGGGIKIQSGGSLLLNGKMTLDGNLELGGFLGIRENGEIGGSGVLTVLNSFDDINCEGTCKAKIKPPEPKNENGCTTIGGVLIANKKYSLPEDYGDGLTDDTYNALLEMREDSGYYMEIVSGFRDYASQQRNFDYWCEIDGYEQALTYSSPPGHSEHQTGLTMDITSLEEDYADTEEGQWLAENCHKYGFIIRYPKGMEHITGYTYEPWHVRYLGKSTAKLVHDSGLTLEEFLGVKGM